MPARTQPSPSPPPTLSLTLPFVASSTSGPPPPPPPPPAYEPDDISSLLDPLPALRDLTAFFIYSQHYNPTVLNLGCQMAALEGTEAAYCTASGMAAISSVLIQLCGSDGHVVASCCLYGGTHAFLTNFLPRACGIPAEFVDIDDIETVWAAIRSDKEAMRVLYVETMSNPTTSPPPPPAYEPDASILCLRSISASALSPPPGPNTSSPIFHAVSTSVLRLDRFHSATAAWAEISGWPNLARAGLGLGLGQGLDRDFTKNFGPKTGQKPEKIFWARLGLG